MEGKDLSIINRSLLLRYGTSMIAVLLALLLTLLLKPLREQTPFPFFFAAIILSSWYGGLVQGLLATGLSALAQSYFFLPLSDPFGIGLGNLVRLATFVLVSVLICLLDSARKRTERALRANETKFRGLLESAPDGVVIVNLEGKIVIINAQVERLFGYDREELLGKHITILLPDQLGEVEVGKNVDFHSDLRLWPRDMRIDFPGQRKDGNKFPVEMRLSLAGTDEGSLAVCTFRDITERKRAEEANIRLAREQAARAEAEAAEARITQLYRQVKEVNRDLEEKIKELNDFTHVVSHDLKEPLRGIEAFSGFLLEDYAPLLDDDGRRYLGFLKISAVRMKDLIHDLLALASISQKDQSLEAVDLSQILISVQHELAFSIQRKGVEIRVPSPLPIILCNNLQIREVLKNLLSNAIKFNIATPPVIEISSGEDGGFYFISVKDNGIGIDPRYREQIFELFKRLHPREEYEGTGAGLAICKKIVEGYGGKIWVESNPGGGSILSFSLPKRQRGLINR